MSIPARLSTATLGVTNLERSTAFYRALGWELSGESQAGEISFFTLNGAILGLWDYYKLAADAHLEAPMAREPGRFNGFTLAVIVATAEEVAPALDAAVAAGARLLKPPTREEWGGT